MITEKKFFTAKYDRVFKAVMLEENNPKLMEGFLSYLLKKEVKIIRMPKNELAVRNTKERVKTVDALVKLEQEYIHIELNIGGSHLIRVRNFNYFTSIYNRNTTRNEEYDTKTKFLHIDFTYGLSKKGEVKRTYEVQSNEGELYIENFQIIEYNMDKVREYWEKKEKEKIKEYLPLIALDLTKEELKEVAKESEYMKEFAEKVIKLNEDEIFESFLTEEEDQRYMTNSIKKLAFEEGVEQGIKKGTEDGEKKKEREIVKNMLEADLEPEKIREFTNLSLEEIKKIKES